VRYVKYDLGMSLMRTSCALTGNTVSHFDANILLFITDITAQLNKCVVLQLRLRTAVTVKN